MRGRQVSKVEASGGCESVRGGCERETGVKGGSKWRCEGVRGGCERKTGVKGGSEWRV